MLTYVLERCLAAGDEAETWMDAEEGRTKVVDSQREVKDPAEKKAEEEEKKRHHHWCRILALQIKLNSPESFMMIDRVNVF